METIKIAFYGFLDSLTEADREKVNGFFSEFDLNFLVSKKERRKFKYDFERAIMALYDRGVPMDEILERLSMSNLCGFYARPSVMWFPLDDAAKIYPISMDHDRQLMFRLSVYFKEDVVPELLQMALTFAIKRFPSFATTLKKGIFWHYLDAVKKRFTIEKETDVPCQPIKVSISGSNSFRLMYYKNRISAEFFHVLTDGTGGMIFLKAIAAEYLRLLGVELDRENRGDLWDINDIPLREEFENSFVKVEKAKNSSGFVDKNALQMNGKLARRRPCRVLHFKMDSKKLYETAKAHGATVTTYVLALMFLACSAATDELSGDINIQVPVNMRKFYPSTTVRNFSMYCGIRIPVEDVKDKDELIPEIASQLEVKGNKEHMHEMITAAVKIVSSIRLIPLVIKQPIAKMVYGFLGEKIYTTTFSNLGVVTMPDALGEHIESMDFCLGAQETNRLATTLITFGDVSTFSISKMTADPTFEESMYKLLTRDGIEVEVEGSDFYAH
ncbi:MAG: hypothetical protein IJW03_03555 [Clostridia bacterium]|nr:hypothetical protein [Clostridia bacterium]